MYIDLTQTFSASIPVYPGDPAPKVEQFATLDKDGFVDHQVTTGMHVGTHIDAPQHFVDGGAAISDIDVARFFGRGVLIDARPKNPIDLDLLTGKDIQPGDIVLICTNWTLKFGQPDYYYSYPELSEALAKALIEKKVSMIGLDTPSPDRPPFPIHKLLLKNDILLIENLTNLEQLFNTPKFQVIALPAKWQTNAGPVRVVAQV